MQLNKMAIIVTVIVVIGVAVVLGVLYQLTNTPAYTQPAVTLPSNQPLTTTSTTGGSTPNGSSTPTSASSSGQLQVQVITPGSGAGAKDGDKLTVNYTGTLTNGTKFDSSLDQGRSPFSFTLGAGQVIPGWDQALVGAKVGEELKLTIPPDLAYGSQSPSPLIPANSTLIFDITVVKIN